MRGLTIDSIAQRSLVVLRADWISCLFFFFRLYISIASPFSSFIVLGSFFLLAATSSLFYTNEILFFVVCAVIRKMLLFYDVAFQKDSLISHSHRPASALSLGIGSFLNDEVRRVREGGKEIRATCTTLATLPIKGSMQTVFHSLVFKATRQKAFSL